MAIHGRVIAKQNIPSIFGDTPASHVADPANAKRIFEWMLGFTYDDKGNCALYEYKPEDGAGLNPLLVHNKNRTNGNAAFSNTLLKRVRCGNVTPCKKLGVKYKIVIAAKDMFVYYYNGSNNSFDRYIAKVPFNVFLKACRAINHNNNNIFKIFTYGFATLHRHI